MKKYLLLITSIILIICTPSQEKQACRLFNRYIASVDSCHNALGDYWKQDELTEVEMRQKAEEWLPLVSTIEEKAKKASEVIAPYDSLLSVAAINCHDTASDAIIYANRFLQGEGSAYFDKLRTWLGHLGTDLQDLQYERNR